MKPIGYKVVMLFLSLAAASPASAAVDGALQPLNYNGRYRISWGGITLGRIIITAKEDGNSYSMRIDTKTSGMGAVVSSDKSVTEAHGIKQDSQYIPIGYSSKPVDNDKRTTTVLSYDEQGHITKRERNPDDDPAWRPPVPNEMINTSTDSVTGAFILRRKLYAAIANGQTEVSTRTYDGARLATMQMTRQPTTTLEVMGKQQLVHDVTITRIPVTGYTPKELKKYAKGDPAIHLYFSDDAAFLPVRASAAAALGELSMTLVDLPKE